MVTKVNTETGCVVARTIIVVYQKFSVSVVVAELSMVYCPLPHGDRFRFLILLRKRSLFLPSDEVSESLYLIQHMWV